MKLSTVLALVAGIVFTIGMAVAAGNPPATLKIDVNKSGKSVPNFPHQKHTEMSDLKDKCVACHHGTKTGETPKACGTCHTQATSKDAKTNAPGFKDAFHKLCVGCHEKQKEKSDLKKCKTCHG